MSESIGTSVVIPCWNSGAWLGPLVDRIVAVMSECGRPFEIILVNDASTDAGTWRAIEDCAHRHPEIVRGINLLFNTGQFRATICGMESARGRYVVTMDDDGQHPPEELPKLLDALRSRPDLDAVIACFPEKHHSVIRNAGSWVNKELFRLLYGKPRDLRISSWRVMTRKVAESICAHRTANPVLGPLLLKSTRRIANVEVNHRPRLDGSSGYRFSRLAGIVFENVLSSSTFPLKVISGLGIVCALLSAGMGCFYLAAYLLGRITQPGFITIVILVMFFGGMTLLSVGLVGEYLIRISWEVHRSPRYVVKETTGESPETTELANHPSIPRCATEPQDRR